MSCSKKCPQPVSSDKTKLLRFIDDLRLKGKVPMFTGNLAANVIRNNLACKYRPLVAEKLLDRLDLIF